MRAVELFIPEFVLVEIPVKDGSMHDERMWIYCPQALSMIEVISEFEIDAVLHSSLIQKRFKFTNSQGEEESFTLGIVQNNCGLAEVDPHDLLDRAWHFFNDYLVWEDSNIDDAELGAMN